MDFSSVDTQLVANLALMLLIGMGPKIALVPFLDMTKNLDAQKKKEVGTKMVMIATITALVLFGIGHFLMRLLHISGGAIGVAGGIILLILALQMFASPGKKHEEKEDVSLIDHHQIAIYPLAIPYLLNPVGIAVLIVASSKVENIMGVGIVVGLVLAVALLDLLVFRNMDKLSKRLTPTKLIISEVVFGILLAALAVELVVKGLGSLGVLDLPAHH